MNGRGYKRTGDFDEIIIRKRLRLDAPLIISGEGKVGELCAAENNVIQMRNYAGNAWARVQDDGSIYVRAKPGFDMTLQADNIIPLGTYDTNIGTEAKPFKDVHVSGDVKIGSTLDTGGDLGVTGNITVTGTVDGVDVATLETDVSNKAPTSSPTFTGVVTVNGSIAPVSFKSTATGTGTDTTDTIAIGTDASITKTGVESICIGKDAGKNTVGVRCVAIGSLAGRDIPIGNTDIVAIGNGAGQTSANFAVAIGNGAGASGQGNGAVAIGNGAGASSQGNQSVAVGKGTASAGPYSVAVGRDSKSGGTNSVAIGFSATANQEDSISLGKSATCDAANQMTIGGSLAADATTEVRPGRDETCNLGSATKKFSTVYCTALNVNGSGFQGFTNPFDDTNMVAGTTAGDSLTGASSVKNVLIGKNAGTALTTASFNNTFIGHETGKTASSSVSGCTYIGAFSGTSATGNSNTCVGDNSGILLTTGGDNTIMGNLSDVGAGDHVTTGIGNTCIGSTTTPDATSDYQIAIGFEASCDASEECCIGGVNNGQSVTVIKPGRDDYTSLGDSSNRFTDLHLTGGVILPVAAAVTTGTATIGDDELITRCDTTDNTVTLTLPDCATNNGKTYTVTLESRPGTNDVNIQRGGTDTINGTTSTRSLVSAGTAWFFTAIGTNWCAWSTN